MSAWWKAAGLRAVRTFAQAMLATIPATIAISANTDWMSVTFAVVNIFGSAALAAGISLLMSIAGLPELNKEDCEQ